MMQVKELLYCTILALTDSQPVTSIEYPVLRVSTGVGNFQTCPSMEKFAWVWIAVIPAIWEALARASGSNRGRQLTKRLHPQSKGESISRSHAPAQLSGCCCGGASRRRGARCSSSTFPVRMQSVQNFSSFALDNNIKVNGFAASRCRGVLPNSHASLTSLDHHLSA